MRDSELRVNPGASPGGLQNFMWKNKKKWIQYRTAELESFEGVIEKLLEEYLALLSKKELLDKELLKTVEEKLKELQQCEIDSQEKEDELERLLQVKISSNKAILENAERVLQEHRERLEETVRAYEEKEAALIKWQELGDRGNQELQREIQALEDEIEKAREAYRKDQEFIYKLWDHFRHIYVKNEKENLDALKMKYLDEGIDGLSSKENFVAQERFRLKMELKQQISTIAEDTNEFRQEEKTAETYRSHLDKLRKKFYKLVPVPSWTSRMPGRDGETNIKFVGHDESDACAHETPFRVPLTVETVWVNYRDPSLDEKPRSDADSSMAANPERPVEATPSPLWRTNRSGIVRRAVRGREDPRDKASADVQQKMLRRELGLQPKNGRC